jgi:hypothetical protein
MTSNGERDFSSAFLRRCLHLDMPQPNAAELGKIVRQQLSGWAAEREKDLASKGQSIDALAKEMAGLAPKDSPLQEDIQLLISQSERCRVILKPLGGGGVLKERSARTPTQGAPPFSRDGTHAPPLLTNLLVRWGSGHACAPLFGRGLTFAGLDSFSA